VAPGDFSRTQVGDESVTSPYRAEPGTVGISTSTYIRNMSELIRFLMLTRSEQEAAAPTQINVVLNWFEELKRCGW
jgi:hypothetical protein